MQNLFVIGRGDNWGYVSTCMVNDNEVINGLLLQQILWRVEKRKHVQHLMAELLYKEVLMLTTHVITLKGTLCLESTKS